MNQIGKNLPQVAEVMPVKLLMTACGSTTDVMALHGVDRELFNYLDKEHIDSILYEMIKENDLILEKNSIKLNVS
jgi:hypothetical protein